MKKLKEESDDSGHTTVLEAAGNALNIVSMTGIFIRIIVFYSRLFFKIKQTAETILKYALI